MVGLLRKDLLYLQRNQKVCIVLIFFYIIYGLMVPGGETMISILIFMSGVLGMSLFSYDESSKWDHYALSLPVTRAQIVAVRYLTTLLLILVFTALSVLVTVMVRLIHPPVDSSNPFFFLLGMVAASIFFASVLLPLCYQFGVEKARIGMLVVVLLPSVAAVLLFNGGFEFHLESLMPLLIAAVSSTPVLFALSMLLSIKIYTKKDF